MIQRRLAWRRFFPTLRIWHLLTVLLLSITQLLVPYSLVTANPSPPYFLFKWGTYGSGDGQLYLPSGVAIDNSENVYVVDQYNHRIQKFTSEGTFIRKWGTLGSGDSQFILPNDVAVDSLGNVYVADSSNHRIQKFTSEGTFITKWGSFGSGDGQFNYPYYVKVDSSDNVYVSDFYNHRIQKFTSDGVFITKWGSFGSNDGQLNLPYGVAVDALGNVYVGDWLNHRIQKFTSEGIFITGWGSFGSGDGQFINPAGMTIDALGSVLVVDYNNHRIQKFTSEGIFITEWGSFGSGDGQFDLPADVEIGTSGNIYVVDYRNNRIQLFGLDVFPQDKQGPLTSNLIVTPNPTPAGEAVTLTAMVDDSKTGSSKITSAQYSIDNGVTWTSMLATDGDLDEATEDVTVTILPFFSVGIVSISVRGQDAAGNWGAVDSILLAVYDPDAGFVTGGGWINSPAGAYLDNPSLTGKAIFGFISKYQKGADIPTGETQFQFRLANLNFHSNTYEWLVVAGARAQYKGSGNINGAGDYGFMLTAIDGDVNGGGGIDKFRMKIWDKASGRVIYDNQLGIDDTAGTTTVIQGGSIVIHK